MGIVTTLHRKRLTNLSIVSTIFLSYPESDSHALTNCWPTLSCAPVQFFILCPLMTDQSNLAYNT